MGQRFRNSMELALGKLLGLRSSYWSAHDDEYLTEAIRALNDVEGIGDLKLPFSFADLRVFEAPIPLFPLMVHPARTHPFIKFLDEDEDYQPILVADGAQQGIEALYVLASLEDIDDVYAWIRDQDTPEFFVKIRKQDGRFLSAFKLKALLGFI